MPRTPHTTLDCSPGCPVEGTLGLIGGKWKGTILYLLSRQTLRFSELHRFMPNATHRMLSMQLRELETESLIVRTVYPVVPPKVEYSLSERGRTLEPILHALKDWGQAHLVLSSPNPMDPKPVPERVVASQATPAK